MTVAGAWSRIAGRLTRRQIVGFCALICIALLVAVLRVLIYRDPVARGIHFDWPAGDIAAIRLTALLAGVIVGTSLSVSGVMLQALLRNPLAEPFILGLSSGAGLGVMAAMYIAHANGGDERLAAARTEPAVLGALATLAVVYALGQRRGWLDPVTLVLVGVIVSTICGAGIVFFQHLVPTGLRGEFTTWLMGHIPERIGALPMVIAAALGGGGLAVGLWLGRAMDAATLGDEEARSVGLSIGSLRLWMFALAGAMAAATVTLAGPIGFVGLIGPHAARLILGPKHTPLVLGAALCGIILIVGADVARQAIDLGAGRMPIGIFTAAIGGPAFIWLLLSGRGQA